MMTTRVPAVMWGGTMVRAPLESVAGRARLAHLYEENYRFEIKNAVPHGVIATLEIPFETIKGSQLETDRIEIK